MKTLLGRLTLPTGQQLAQCGMVLNNASWMKLQDGCPEALSAPLNQSGKPAAARVGKAEPVPHRRG